MHNAVLRSRRFAVSVMTVNVRASTQARPRRGVDVLISSVKRSMTETPLEALAKKRLILSDPTARGLDDYFVRWDDVEAALTLARQQVKELQEERDDTRRDIDALLTVHRKALQRAEAAESELKDELGKK